MNFPENLKYTSQHEWILVRNSTGTIGITDYAQSELGDVVFIEFPPVGKQVRKGESCATIEAVKTVADLFSPVSGEVIEVNEKLKTAPELVNKDPYGEGWMVKLRVNDPTELGALLSATDYRKLVGQ